MMADVLGTVFSSPSVLYLIFWRNLGFMNMENNQSTSPINVKDKIAAHAPKLFDWLSHLASSSLRFTSRGPEPLEPARVSPSTFEFGLFSHLALPLPCVGDWIRWDNYVSSGILLESNINWPLTTAFAECIRVYEAWKLMHRRASVSDMDAHACLYLFM